MRSDNLLIILVIAFLIRGVAVIIIKQRAFNKLNLKIATHKQALKNDHTKYAEYAQTKAGRALLHLLSVRFHRPSPKELQALLGISKQNQQSNLPVRPTFERPLEIQLEGIQMAQALSGILEDEPESPAAQTANPNPMLFIEAVTAIDTKQKLATTNTQIKLSGLSNELLDDTFAKIDDAVVKTDRIKTMAYLKVIAGTVRDQDNLKEGKVFTALLEKSKYLLTDLGVNFNASINPEFAAELKNLAGLLTVFIEDVKTMPANTSPPLKLKSMGILCGKEFDELAGWIAKVPTQTRSKFKPV